MCCFQLLHHKGEEPETSNLPIKWCTGMARGFAQGMHAPYHDTWSNLNGSGCELDLSEFTAALEHMHN